MRIVGVLKGLARLGDVDLFVMAPGARQPIVPEDAPVRKVGVGSRVAPAYRGLGRLRWAVSGQLPLELDRCDFGPTVRGLERWMDSEYDVVWCNRAASYIGVRSVLRWPTIVDLDDLEDRKLIGVRTIRAEERRVATRSPWKSYRDRRNAGLWSELQQTIAGAADAVVVTSDLDRARLGVPGAVVIPNGYDAPLRPLGKPVVGRPPTILFQGLMTYPPNVDGARWLVREVLPYLRAQLGTVRIRLVGQAEGEVLALATDPEVVVTGHVDSMADELARADLIVVPIRFGSGTRVKILEAFAHRIPVASTHVGAEGLAVQDGRELLMADEAESLAEACIRLLSEPDLRRSVVAEAQARFDADYRWEAIHSRVQLLVEQMVGREASVRSDSDNLIQTRIGDRWAH
jgi:glycosyltransferase involved in cell wall biosynthesis